MGPGATKCETLEYESIKLERIRGQFDTDLSGKLSSDDLHMGQWNDGATDQAKLGQWLVTGASARCYYIVKGKETLNTENGVGADGWFEMPFSVIPPSFANRSRIGGQRGWLRGRPLLVPPLLGVPPLQRSILSTSRRGGPSERTGRRK